MTPPDGLSAYDQYHPQANHRLLSAAEEQALLARRDPAAVEELVACNQRLVFSLALRFNRSPMSARLELMDLVQAGNVGLLTAIRKYNAAAGVRLSTYAVPWVRQYIRRHCLRHGQTANLSTRDAVHSVRARFARARLSQSLLAEPSHQQIAQEAGISTADLALFEQAERAFSLDAIHPAGNHEDELEISIPDPESIIWHAASDAALDVHALLSRLDDPRQRQALELRFGLGGQPEHRYHQIGAALGFSRTCAQNLVAAGLAELRRMATATATI